LSNSVVQSLEDQAWLAVSAAADAKLHEAAFQCEKALTETLDYVAKAARESKYFKK